MRNSEDRCAGRALAEPENGESPEGSRCAGGLKRKWNKEEAACH